MESRGEQQGPQSYPATESLPFITETTVPKPEPAPVSRKPQKIDGNWLLNEVQFLRKAVWGLIIGLMVAALLLGVMQYMASQERAALKEEIRTMKSDYRSLEDRFNLLIDLMVAERDDTPAKGVR